MSRAPSRTERVLAALHRTFLNTLYDYAADGYVISSDETKEYHVMLMFCLTKGEEPRVIRGSCTCRDWRLGVHRESYLCIHCEAVALLWRRELVGDPGRDVSQLEETA